MNDETIKKTLIRDLEKISAEDFNKEIIQKINVLNKKEKLILFDEKVILKTFLFVFLFILIINTVIIENLMPSSIMIGLLFCVSPLFFMIFNKILQSTIQN